MFVHEMMPSFEVLLLYLLSLMRPNSHIPFAPESFSTHLTTQRLDNLETPIEKTVINQNEHVLRFTWKNLLHIKND